MRVSDGRRREDASHTHRASCRQLPLSAFCLGRPFSTRRCDATRALSSCAHRHGRARHWYVQHPSREIPTAASPRYNRGSCVPREGRPQADTPTREQYVDGLGEMRYTKGETLLILRSGAHDRNGHPSGRLRPRRLNPRQGPNIQGLRTGRVSYERHRERADDRTVCYS